MLNSYLITVCKNTSFLAITSKTILSKKPPIEVLYDYMDSHGYKGQNLELADYVLIIQEYGNTLYRWFVNH